MIDARETKVLKRETLKLSQNPFMRVVSFDATVADCGEK
jgi:hypothetical protein